MSSGTTLKEIQRFFEYLKQSKTNNEMTILITNDMCKDLQIIVEDLCRYKEILQERIDKAIEYIKEELYEVGGCIHGSDLPHSAIEPILEILGDKENE